MILVIGGTGFIGRALIRQLAEAGHPVRILLRPSKTSPSLPTGIPLEVAVTSLRDERSLQAAMVGVDTIFHLVGGEWAGSRANLLEADIRPTQAVVDAAIKTGVRRFLTVSHLGADRASAYPVLKTKGVVEETIRRSGLDYTILRSAIVYGQRDYFTTGLARLFHLSPFIFPIPGDGSTLLQPIWVEDLATCLVWALEDDSTRNQTYELGGPDFFQFREIVTMLMQKTRTYRRIVSFRPPYLRLLTTYLDTVFPNLPTSVFWLDYLATNRTAPLDTVPRIFKLMPSRMPLRLDYLSEINWNRELWKTLFRKK